MDHPTTYAPWRGETVPTRLLEVASLLEACRATFVRIARDSRWQPLGGSLAAEDQEILASRDPNVTSGETFAGFDLVCATVTNFMEVAAGHLAAMAALYRSGEVFFSPRPASKGRLGERRSRGLGDRPRRQLRLSASACVPGGVQGR